MSKNSLLDINDILNDYSHDIQDAITEEAIKIAKEGIAKLKKTSPINKKSTSHKGKYAKGWRVKTEKGRGFVNCTIYNATDWQLTHLLENGHDILDKHGQKRGYVGAKKHIAPINDECAELYEKGVIRVIQGSGK